MDASSSEDESDDELTKQLEEQQDEIEKLRESNSKLKNDMIRWRHMAENYEVLNATLQEDNATLQTELNELKKRKGEAGAYYDSSVKGKYTF